MKKQKHILHMVIKKFHKDKIKQEDEIVKESVKIVGKKALCIYCGEHMKTTESKGLNKAVAEHFEKCHSILKQYKIQFDIDFSHSSESLNNLIKSSFNKDNFKDNNYRKLSILDVLKKEDQIFQVEQVKGLTSKGIKEWINTEGDSNDYKNTRKEFKKINQQLIDTRNIITYQKQHEESKQLYFYNYLIIDSNKLEQLIINKLKLNKSEDEDIKISKLEFIQLLHKVGKGTEGKNLKMDGGKKSGFRPSSRSKIYANSTSTGKNIEIK